MGRLYPEREEPRLGKIDQLAASLAACRALDAPQNPNASGGSSMR